MKPTLILTGLMVAALALQAGAFELPKPQKFTLANGLTVYHLAQHDLPLVSFRLIISGAGNCAVSAEQEGLADLTAELLLKGTRSKSAAELAEAIDFIGAELDTRARAEYAEMSGSALSGNLPTLMALAGECLLQPAFAASEFKLEQGRRIDDLVAIKDNPQEAVRYYFQKAWFGAHPLGRLSIGNESALAAMTPEAPAAFYRAHYHPNMAVMAVVGDIRLEDLKALVRKHFGGWKAASGATAAASLPALPPRGQSRYLLIDKPDATQAYFMLGAPGLPMGDPRIPAATVMNTLFGGRFTSWLVTELRVKRGLTYGARATLQSWNHLGLYSISSYTRNEKIGEMLQVTFDLINKARQEGFSDEEITSGRNYILGQFPPSLESQMAKAQAYTDLHFYGLGSDYYTRFLQSIATVQPDQSREMAQTLMPADPVVLVVVGKAAEIRAQLEKFASFEVRSIEEAGF
ncbi:MAG TPA: pitrilysin family protein [bacterium]|nr:pitrilysin family protein [bacterium]HQI47923.1 pitrilysin family protein [bacterium]HQJ64408.1 pitrilysin family protein [bacterium]HQJ65520.1 pitrilysin family protein [bacterium]